MTSLDKPLRRVTRGGLDYCYGKDRGRRLIASLEVGDLLTLRPYGTRRSEAISLFDVYRYALQCRVNRTRLEKARAVKAKKVERLAELRYRRSLRAPLT
jgi:hypothetical protein